ncbi:hypothetical protein P22_2106 [Propionispora sp. 2/2-37]|uniref:aspartate/glutamate racemase family protein n=1 Tax=Propionispora sp. 2/2-37 TaxID=1677858 RepID=UPI0006BB90D8|nr:amino acid racemase [Propionispora sp. 2/2-37]CUH96018.1 hypothetical protein P22_2106 [Propionispora sp. 2/2-37]
MLTVGILGGMGPLATVDLFKKIVECTPAVIDQEHLKMIVYSNPQIPSRIDAIMSGAQSPEKELIQSAQFLEKAGADILVMPCNTAHFWYQAIQDSLKIKIINMIETAAEYVKNHYAAAGLGKIMLLATAATVKAKLYQTAFAAKGFILIEPQPDEQKIISGAINETKAGLLAQNSFLPAMQQLLQKYQQLGVNSFIAGCTEMPLIFDQLSGNYHEIDPTKLLAQEVVKQALADYIDTTVGL